MSGEQRILLAFEMSLFAREPAKEEIRRESIPSGRKGA
jgi:hypothetical protein